MDTLNISYALDEFDPEVIEELENVDWMDPDYQPIPN